MIASLLIASLASAGTVKGQLKIVDKEGKALNRPAVIYVVGPPEESPSAKAVEMKQKGKSFRPGLLVVPKGTPVRFTNFDPFDHNVFSVSSTRPFDIGHAGEGETREVTFNEPGLVEIFCNIHVAMYAAVFVMPHKYWSVVRKDESAYEIKDVPAGHHKLYAWTRGTPPVSVDLEMSKDAVVEKDWRLEIERVNPPSLDKHGQKRKGVKYP